MAFSSFVFGHLHVANGGVSQKPKNRMANGVDPDETVCYELSYLDLTVCKDICFGLKGLTETRIRNLLPFLKKNIFGADFMTPNS